MVKRKVTVMAVLAVLLAGLSPLAAQQSETNKATATVFTNDVDIYMDVIDFKNLDLGKMFSFAGVRRNNLELGYAGKMADNYIAAYFSGNFYQLADAGYDITVETSPTVVNGEIVSESIVVTKALNDNPGLAENELSVLLGLGNMGFKLSIYQNQAFYQAPAGMPDSVVTTDTGTDTIVTEEYTKTSRVEGYLLPLLTWGMPMAFGENTLKPRISLGALLVQSNAKASYDENTTVNGETPIGASVLHGEYIRKQGSLSPVLGANIGLDMPEKEGVQMGFGLEYGLTVNLYPSKMSERTIQTSTTVTFADTTVTEGETNASNPGFGMVNTLAPSLYYTKTIGERLSVGFNSRIGVSFENSKHSAQTTQVINTTFTSNSGNVADNYEEVYTAFTPGDTVSSMELSIDPSINFGFTYQVVPGKFQVNAGYAIQAPVFSTTRTLTTRSDYYKETSVRTWGDGDVDTFEDIYGDPTSIDEDRTETLERVNSWDAFRGTLSFGCGFVFSPQFSLDSSMLFANTTPSLFGANGILTTNMSFMFTLKL